MATLSEQIQQANRQEAESRILTRAQSMSREERDILIGYLKTIGEHEFAKRLFGLESLDIESPTISIITPEEKQIYRGNQHDERGFQIPQRSKGELHLLLQAFFQNSSERTYIIETFFHEDAFLSKTSGDIMDYLARAESLFQRASTYKKRVLTLVSDGTASQCEDAANDEHFTPLVDRIWDEEPGCFDYIHETYQARLEFIESLFIETIRHLAEEPRNHIWALDPESVDIYIPVGLQSKIDLIRSICEFHKSFDSGFPMLHTLVPSTLASWILLYKGFSAPAYQVRNIFA